MRRFGRFGFEPATQPVLRDDAEVFGTSMPGAPATDPSLPAGFPGYSIQPEVLGAPVDGATVPGLYDQGTLVSLFPSLVSSMSVDEASSPPPGVKPLLSPEEVADIFNTKASETLDQAIEMDYAAALQKQVAEELQRKADAAAYAAEQAIATATMDPRYEFQAIAEAAAKLAEEKQYEADLALEKAAVIDQEADARAARAQEDARRLAAKIASGEAAYEKSVYQADKEALEEAWDTPGLVVPEAWWPPEVFEQRPGVSPLVAAGIAGVVGFLFGGPIGAVVGGVGGYFVGRRTTR